MKTTIRTITVVVALILGMFLLADLARADAAGDYGSQCAKCHAADGKKMVKDPAKVTVDSCAAALGKGAMASVKLEAAAAKAVCEHHVGLLKK